MLGLGLEPVRTREKKPKNRTGAEEPAAYSDAPVVISRDVRPHEGIL